MGDIRTKTGWQSPRHSERDSAYIPFITPTELIANLDKYHRDTIKMQILFKGVSTRGLNIWIGTKGNRYIWSSKRYISFNINGSGSKDIYLFIPKGNPDVDKLLALSRDTSILVTGIVKDISRGKVWIEVRRIESL